MPFLEKNGEDLGERRDRGRRDDRFDERREPSEERDKTDQSEDEEHREGETQEREEEEILGVTAASIRKEILTRSKAKDKTTEEK